MSHTAHRFALRLINHRPFRVALLGLIALSLLIGIAIVPVEAPHPRVKIQTVEEGLWWATTTVTGVGYGDYVPVTTFGRVLGIILQIAGVLMFGLIIGIIGVTMSRRQEEYEWFRLFERLDHVDEKLRQIEKKSDYLLKQEQHSTGNENDANHTSKADTFMEDQDSENNSENKTEFIN